MHELGIMSSVMDVVEKSAQDAGAQKVLKVSLSIGVLNEAVEEPLRFAFEALTEGTISDGADLEIIMVKPRSVCNDCDNEYEHDRFHMSCPKCESFNTHLVAGKEMQINSIEVDIPDNEETDQN